MPPNSHSILKVSSIACALVCLMLCQMSADPVPSADQSSRLPINAALILRADVKNDVLEFGFDNSEPIETMLEVSFCPGPSIAQYDHESGHPIQTIISEKLSDLKRRLLRDGAVSDHQIGVKVALYARRKGAQDAYRLLETRFVDIRGEAK